MEGELSSPFVSSGSLLITFDHVKPERRFHGITHAVDFECKGGVAEGFDHTVGFELSDTSQSIEGGGIVGVFLDEGGEVVAGFGFFGDFFGALFGFVFGTFHCSRRVFRTFERDQHVLRRNPLRFVRRCGGFVLG